MVSVFGFGSGVYNFVLSNLFVFFLVCELFALVWALKKVGRMTIQLKIITILYFIFTLFLFFLIPKGIFGGYLLGVRTATGLSFYDWESLDLVRRIEVQPK